MVSLKDWRRKNGFAVFTIVVMLLGVLSIALVPPVRATATPFSNHMVFIIMENNPLNGITSTTAPYMHSLASTYANSTNFVGPVSSAWSPSLPNYIGLTSGSTQSITDDGGPSTHPVSGRNIIDAFDIAQVSITIQSPTIPIVTQRLLAQASMYLQVRQPVLKVREVLRILPHATAR